MELAYIEELKIGFSCPLSSADNPNNVVGRLCGSLEEALAFASDHYLLLCLPFAHLALPLYSLEAWLDLEDYAVRLILEQYLVQVPKLNVGFCEGGKGVGEVQELHIDDGVFFDSLDLFDGKTAFFCDFIDIPNRNDIVVANCQVSTLLAVSEHWAIPSHRALKILIEIEFANEHVSEGEDVEAVEAGKLGGGYEELQKREGQDLIENNRRELIVFVVFIGVEAVVAKGEDLQVLFAVNELM